MSRMKIMLVGFLAALALGSVASASASALEGPWFRTPESAGSQKQVKIGYNQEKAIKGAIASAAFTLKGKLAGVTVLIKCTIANNTGNIWNGRFQGEDNGEVKFGGCTTGSPCPAGTEVKVEPAKVYSELQWKYAGNQKELTEVGQQKIHDVFAPTEEAIQKEGVVRTVFTHITLPESCPVKPLVFTVEAAGTPTEFVDQNQEVHKVVWGTAALTEPQNEDAKVGNLVWKFPNVTELHHQGGQTKAKLLFAGSPAELEGTIAVERNNGELYGVYNE